LARAQLAPAMSGDGTVAAVISGSLDKTATTVAQVTVAGRAAPILYVGNAQINAPVPFDTHSGAQAVVVNNGNGSSATFNVNVAPAAPAS
jgi:uncharacterized protein (TIGR03437 family)